MNMTTETSPVDNLIAGDFPRLTKMVTIKTGAGAKFVKGEIIELDGTKKGIKLATEANANCILAQDVDATASDVEALAYITGEFHLNECVYNQSLASDDIVEKLHLRSIFLK